MDPIKLAKVIEQDAKGFFEKLEEKILSEPVNLKDHIDKKGFEIRNSIRSFEIVTKRNDYSINGASAHNYWTFIYNPNENFKIPADTILDITKNKKFNKALETHFKAMEYFGKI